MLPLFDVKDDLDGRRFAIVEGIDVDESGGVRRQSGIATLKRGLSTHAERPAPRPHAADSQPRLGAPLADALAARAGTMLEVQIHVRRSDFPTLTHLKERAIAEGQVVTKDDLAAVRESLVFDRQLAIEKAQEPAVRALRSLGGRVLDRQENLHALTALMPAAAIETLLLENSIVRIDLTELIWEESPSGLEHREGEQLNQFINDGFDGERGNASDISFAHIEGQEIDDTIFAFREGSGGTRIRGLFNCSSSACTQTSSFTNPAAHPTKTAAIIFGDLEDGQDPNVTSQVARRELSGFATEAKGYFFDLDGGSTTTLARATDAIVAISSFQPVAVNLSFGAGSDASCLGQNGPSRDMNELFESGTLPFKSAGNNGSSNFTDCTVTSPGSAIGAFTVGAYGSTASIEEDQVRTDDICGVSSRGGTATEGGGRKVVDLAAYAPREATPSVGNTYTGQGCFTSYAAPAALGASLDFADHYFRNYGSLIDGPGYRFVVMLLMGDRETQSGVKTEFGFDNVWGSGRMQMRRWDGEGMDSPWGAYLASTCVDHRQSFVWQVNSGAPLSADVNVFKAAAYWYDRRHEDGTAIDDIDMYLHKDGALVQASAFSGTEMERIRYLINGGGTLELELFGNNVTSSEDPLCGANSQRVYFAYFYEDSDRDDGDGPFAGEIATE